MGSIDTTCYRRDALNSKKHVVAMMKNPIKHITISFRIQSLFGWLSVILLSVVPVVLWLRLQTTNPIASIGLFVETVGLLAGIVGTVLYALSLVLMTRLRLLEGIFGGLNRVYIAHHIVGGLSLVFVLLHPVGLALIRAENSMQSAALLLLPNGLTPLNALFDSNHIAHVIVVEQWAVFAGIIGLWLMLGLLLVTIFIKIPYRIWLISHKLLGLVFLVVGLHIFFVQSDTSDDPLLRWYLLGAMVVGLVAFIYKSIMGQIVIRKYRFAVESMFNLGSGILRLNMAPLQKPLRYISGQFVFVRFLHAPGISREWHPFSISSCANVDTSLQLTIKALGDYTSQLSKLQPGAIAEVEGAYGKFSYTNFANRDQIWIAGGIGITPFLSMIKDLPPDGYRVYLFYSVKTRDEIIDWDLLYNEMAKKINSLRIVPFIDDEQPGLLNIDIVERACGGIEGRDIYICGPPQMMKSLKQQLKERGVPSTSIHSEEFSMS